LARSTPHSAIAAVKSSALIGSPFCDVTAKGFRKGMTPSAAIACSSLGAPEKYVHTYFEYLKTI